MEDYGTAKGKDWGTESDMSVSKQRSSQVEEQMNLTGNQLDHLEKVVATLEEKLKIVINIAAPIGSTNECEQENMAPLADTMRTNNIRLSNRINDLENIIHRLEL